MLQDKVSIVTGGSRGIGRAVVEALARAGSAVAVVATREEGARQAAESAAAHGVKTLSFAADVSDPTEADRVVETVAKELGRVDVLVNNAGITRDGLMMRMSDEDFDRVIAVNLKGTFNFMRAAARVMVKQRSGSIVNVSSVVGLIGNPGQANYAASKGGVIALTKASAKELAARKVRVNAIAPGFIATDMTADLAAGTRDAALSLIPMREFGQPEHIADAVVFLAGPQSSYVTGHVLTVDGGMAM
ncbi:MAG: 3-oxoacyl-[acyl-carrier-protein] reductase [Planctomycetota bacterium]